MPPKAIDARKRLDRNKRFRGHGPLLQEPVVSARDRWRINGGYTRGSPLVSTPRGHPQRAGRPERGPSPCLVLHAGTRRGPPARQAGMVRSHRGRFAAAHITQGDGFRRSGPCPPDRLLPAALSPTCDGGPTCYAAERKPCGFCDCQCHVSRHMASISSSAFHPSAFHASAGSA